MAKELSILRLLADRMVRNQEFGVTGAKVVLALPAAYFGLTTRFGPT